MFSNHSASLQTPFSLTFLFRGFKNPRLFALWASRLPEGFYNEGRITIKEKRLEDADL